MVLYLYSYASFRGSAAIAGFAKAGCVAVGQTGGIMGLIYQAAFLPKERISLNEMIGGQHPPWQDPDVSSYPPQWHPDQTRGTLYWSSDDLADNLWDDPGEYRSRPRQGSKINLPRRRAGTARDRSRGSYTLPIDARVHYIIGTGTLSGPGV